jgi:hypothetical protein
MNSNCFVSGQALAKQGEWLAVNERREEKTFSQLYVKTIVWKQNISEFMSVIWIW